MQIVRKWQIIFTRKFLTTLITSLSLHSPEVATVLKTSTFIRKLQLSSAAEAHLTIIMMTDIVQKCVQIRNYMQN